MIELSKNNPDQEEYPKLPKDWDIIDFESTILKKKVNVEEIPVSKYLLKGKYKIIDQSKKFIAGYWDNEEDVYKGELPVIIFGDHTRIFKYIEFPFVCGAQGTKVLIPNKEILNPQYYHFALSKLNIENRGYNRHFSLLKKKKIPLPPLAEQRNIAFVLSTVQETIEKTQAVIQATQELKKSLMNHLFTYGPIPITEREQVKLKETELGEIPEEWEIVKLGEVTKKSYSGGTPSTKNKGYWNGEIPWTTTQIIDKEDIYLNRYQKTITKDGLKNSSTKIVPKGSIIIGTRVGVGKAVVTTFDIAISQDSTGIILDGKIIPEFVILAMKTEELQKNFRARQRGTTIKGIAREDLLSIKIPFPPISDQKRIIDIFISINLKIKEEISMKSVLEQLFKSLLENLMTGKLRIKDLKLHNLQSLEMEL